VLGQNGAVTEPGGKGRLVVLAPMRVELAAVVKVFGLTRADDGLLDRTSSGVVGAVEVHAGLAGIGVGPATRAAEAAIDALAPDHVVVCGIAGGIGSRHDLGELLVPGSVGDADSGIEFTATPLGPREPAGLIITTDGLWSHEELVAHPLVARSGATAVDMETAAVAAVCQRRGVPWTAFRAISDRTTDGLVGDDVMALTNPDGSTNSAAVTRLLLRRPWVVPRLARLARDTDRATRVAAEAALEACRAWTPEHPTA
jgi:nucleoside phosphorylase